MTNSVGQGRTGGRFGIILADGNIREASVQGNPEAVQREYETKDGAKNTKWEIPYNTLIGKITNVYFIDGTYGYQLKVEITGPEGDAITISMNADSNFGTDLMKKLPNIDLDKTIVFNPYSLITDAGKNKRGISIKVGETKIMSAFYDGEKNLLGFPEVDKDKDYSKDDWKIYFLGVKQFLVDYTEKNICPKFDKKAPHQQSVEDKAKNYPSADDEAIDPNLIPF